MIYLCIYHTYSAYSFENMTSLSCPPKEQEVLRTCKSSKRPPGAPPNKQLTCLDTPYPSLLTCFDRLMIDSAGPCRYFVAFLLFTELERGYDHRRTCSFELYVHRVGWCFGSDLPILPSFCAKGTAKTAKIYCRTTSYCMCVCK